MCHELDTKVRKEDVHVYSGTPLMWTLSLFRGKYTLRKHIWDIVKTEVSLQKGSTVLSSLHATKRGPNRKRVGH